MTLSELERLAREGEHSAPDLWIGQTVHGPDLCAAILALIERCRAMEALLRDTATDLNAACDEVEEAWPYAGDYFEDKWRDKKREATWRERARTALLALDAREGKEGE